MINVDKMRAAKEAKGNVKVKVPSRKKAISGKCRDCIYDECSHGTWLQQVTACDSVDCALWVVRPMSKAKVEG